MAPGFTFEQSIRESKFGSAYPDNFTANGFTGKIYGDYIYVNNDKTLVNQQFKDLHSLASSIDFRQSGLDWQQKLWAAAYAEIDEYISTEGVSVKTVQLNQGKKSVQDFFYAEVQMNGQKRILNKEQFIKFSEKLQKPE